MPLPIPEPTLQLIGGSFQDSEGNPLANGYLIFELNQDELISSEGVEVCAGIKVKVTLDADGNVTGTIPTDTPQYIWANDLMVPGNSFYTVSAYTAHGQLAWGPNVQQVPSDPNPYNLDAWIPNQVIQWVPPLQKLTLQTNGINNVLQSLLNLSAGSNITIIDGGDGTITISAGTSIISATATISAAQLASLVATPVTVLAAPGAGKGYMVFGSCVQYVYGTATYVVPSGDGNFTMYTQAEGPGGANWLSVRRVGFIDQAANQIAQSPNNYMAYLPQTDFENQPIVFGTDAATDITTGDGVLKVTVFYSLINV